MNYFVYLLFYLSFKVNIKLEMVNFFQFHLRFFRSIATTDVIRLRTCRSCLLIDALTICSAFSEKFSTSLSKKIHKTPFLKTDILIHKALFSESKSAVLNSVHTQGFTKGYNAAKSFVWG
jgi:hypothetical protein